MVKFYGCCPESYEQKRGFILPLVTFSPPMRLSIATFAPPRKYEVSRLNQPSISKNDRFAFLSVASPREQ